MGMMTHGALATTNRPPISKMNVQIEIFAHAAGRFLDGSAIHKTVKRTPILSIEPAAPFHSGLRIANPKAVDKKQIARIPTFKRSKVILRSLSIETLAVEKSEKSGVS